MYILPTLMPLIGTLRMESQQLVEKIIANNEAMNSEMIRNAGDNAWLKEHGHDIRLRLANSYHTLANMERQSEIARFKSVDAMKSSQDISHAEAVRRENASQAGQLYLTLAGALSANKELMDALASKLWTLKI